MHFCRMFAKKRTANMHSNQETCNRKTSRKDEAHEFGNKENQQTMAGRKAKWNPKAGSGAAANTAKIGCATALFMERIALSTGKGRINRYGTPSAVHLPVWCHPI